MAKTAVYRYCDDSICGILFADTAHH